MASKEAISKPSSSSPMNPTTVEDAMIEEDDGARRNEKTKQTEVNRGNLDRLFSRFYISHRCPKHRVVQWTPVVYWIRCDCNFARGSNSRDPRNPILILSNEIDPVSRKTQGKRFPASNRVAQFRQSMPRELTSATIRYIYWILIFPIQLMLELTSRLEIHVWQT